MSNTVGKQKTIDLLAEYRVKLSKFAKQCLKIRDKEGTVDFFPGFNSAQKYLHNRLQEQLRDKGFVRAIILKGRQQGISTYTAIRYYRKASLFRGVNVYILSHEQTASDSLFKIVDRFQTHNPIKPSTGIANVKELEFDKMDSSYTVATAGQKAGGRSKTTSLFHGSEVAFWQSAKDHFASSVQTVPLAPGTEVILESTANGASGEFYERWQDAVNNVGDYIPIFIPWFWQEEYKREVPSGFELSTEPGDTGVSEKEYQKLFDLTFEQMAWRRAKVAELRSVHLFDQEYPASPEMAFQSADAKKSLILPILVLRARKRKDVRGAGPPRARRDPPERRGARRDRPLLDGPRRRPPLPRNGSHRTVRFHLRRSPLRPRRPRPPARPRAAPPRPRWPPRARTRRDAGVRRAPGAGDESGLRADRREPVPAAEGIGAGLTRR